MDEELRLKMLSRARKENVIKVGTYDYLQKGMPIFQRDETSEFALYYDLSSDNITSAEEEAIPEAELSTEDLASQIISSNFKTGLSQSEVDKILMGML